MAGGKLILSKIGKIKIKLHRAMEGCVKTLTISRSADGKWFACFSVETAKEILEPTGKSVGIDCGIKIFAVLSNGGAIENPRFFKRDEKRIAVAQCRLSKKAKGTKERHKKRQIVAKIHTRIRNRRNNFAHQVSSFLVRNFDQIFFEDLNIKEMMKNHSLAKAIGDVAWSQMIQFTTYKGENTDRNVRMVNPKNTSQLCSRCGEMVKKDLSCRVHHCLNCGLEICWDLNAALNIKTLGLQSLGFALEAASKR